MSVVVLLTEAFWAPFDFSPDISVSTDSPLNPEQPLSSPFTVTNNWNLVLHQFTYACFIDYAGGGGPFVENIGITRGSDVTPKVRGGESKTFVCPPAFAISDLETVELEIIVEYRPFLRLWPVSMRTYRFETLRRTDGSWLWKPQPSQFD